MKHSFKSWIALLLCLLLLVPTVLTACKKKGENPEDSSSDTADTSNTEDTSDTSDSSEDTSDTSDTEDTEDTEDTDESEEVIEATGLSFKEEEITINLNDSLTLAPVFAPLNATDKTLTWTSSDTTIATVDDKGVVTPLAGGTTTITATLAANEEISASCEVTIIYSALEIALDATEITMTLGEEGYLISETLTPEESNDTVTWVSSDPTIVEADPDGYLYARKSGTVTITATTGSGISATCKVTVISCGVTSDTLTSSRGHKLSASVSNATKTFNFDENLIANEGTTYFISATKENPTALESNTVNLAIGNNVFYVVATDGADTIIYEVTIRRRPIYTVTVDVNGGSALADNTIEVEEGSKITPPATTMEGYFCTWDADLTAPVMGNMTIKATWHRSVYTFTYDDSCGPTLAGTSHPVFFGDYFGETITQQKLDSDGNPVYQNVQKVDPNTGEPMFDGDDNPIYEQEIDPESGEPMVDGDGNPIYKQEPVFEEVPNPAASRYKLAAAPTRTGYAFQRFEIIEENCNNLFTNGKAWDVMRDITIRAIWEALPYKVTLSTKSDSTTFSGSLESSGTLLSGSDASYENPYDSTVTVKAPPANIGYTFVGWYEPFATTTPDLESIPYSTDREYTFTMGLDIALEAVYVLNDDMKDFVFDSYTDPTKCTITGFKDTFDKNLSEFTFPACVTNIAEGLFAGMSNLSSFAIPEGTTAFTFANGNLIETATKTLMWAEATATIPNDATIVTRIGKNAFENSRGLFTITIPENIESISENAFLNCKQLVEIKNLSALTITAGDATANGGIAKYAKNVYNPENGGQSYINKTEDGLSLYNDGTSIVLVGYTGSATELVLPAQFDGKDYTIGFGALSGCTNLTKITIPFVGANIDAYSKLDGTQLFGYIFGAESYDQVGEYVPSTLTEVTVTGGTQIGKQAFRDCKNITKITLPEGLKIIQNLAFQDCTVLTTFNLPSTVTDINDAFKGCSALTEITIPAGIKELERSVFEGCSSLTSITIPSTVTEIMSGAFKNCTSLTSVTFGSSVEKIGTNAFEGCVSLTSITIPSTVTEITSGVFKNCTSLTSVTFGSSVEKIGTNAFEGCVSLTSITLPANITQLNKNAFKGCTALSSVTFELTDGWCVGTTATNAKPNNGKKGWAVDATILTDPAKAATALTTVDTENGGYLELVWKYVEPTT